MFQVGQVTLDLAIVLMREDHGRAGQIKKVR
jgi:hypothetical protein